MISRCNHIIPLNKKCLNRVVSFPLVIKAKIKTQVAAAEKEEEQWRQRQRAQVYGEVDADEVMPPTPITTTLAAKGRHLFISLSLI